MKQNVRKNRLFLKAASLLLIFSLLAAGGCGKSSYTRIPFRYQSGSEDEESYLYYSDRFFDKPSTVYDPSLATASLSFALASFASTRGSQYSHRYANIEEVLQKAGFQDLFVNEDYQKKPGTDSLGVVIAQKPLRGKTLLYLGIRGANYESEWASNFTIGSGEKTSYHEGFYEASEIALKALEEYISSRAVKGELMLWISGYSRAGATCNITAGRLDEMLLAGTAFPGQAVILKKEDLYAYCFESPRGVPLGENNYPKSEAFNNIFCLVNRNDPVPLVAMESLGFTRFGVEMVLPDSVTDYHFDKVLEKVKAAYGKLRSFGDWGVYKVSDFTYKMPGTKNKPEKNPLCNWTQGLFLEELLNNWAEAGIRSRAEYAEHFQGALRDLFRIVYVHKNSSASFKDLALQLAMELLFYGESNVLVDDLLHNPSQLKKDLKPLLHRSLLRMGIEMQVDELAGGLVDLLASLLETFSRDSDLFLSCLSLDNFKAIASAHYPELCLAFMRCMDPLYTRQPLQPPLDGSYYLLKAPGSSSASVKCGQKTVALIEEGTVLKTDSLLPYGIKQGELMIYLPAHESYEIHLSSDQDVSLFLTEPRLLKSSEQRISVTPEGEGFRLIVPALP